MNHPHFPRYITSWSILWLPEQKWVVSYCAFLILFMNPIGVVIILGPSIIFPPSLPFSSAVISSFGNYGTWVVWFCFAAPVMCRKQSPWIFYTPRILYCLIVFIFSVVLAVYDYSYLLHNSDIQLFANSEDWPTIDDVTYVTLKNMYAGLDCSLYVLWILQMFYTRHQLSKISYMKNRYLHLSYHYFKLQGGVSIIYYFIKFIIVDTDCFRYGLDSLHQAILSSMSLGFIDIEMDFPFQTVYCFLLE